MLPVSTTKDAARAAAGAMAEVAASRMAAAAASAATGELPGRCGIAEAVSGLQERVGRVQRAAERCRVVQRQGESVWRAPASQTAAPRSCQRGLLHAGVA